MVDEQQFSFEHLETWHGEAYGARLGDGSRVEVMDFHGAVEVVVEAHGGRIGYHVVGHLHHLPGEGLVDGVYAEGVGSTDDFHHLLVDELSRGGVAQELVRLCL